MHRHSVIICALLIAMTLAMSVNGQFNFSPNWGKRSLGFALSEPAKLSREAVLASRVMSAYYACKVRTIIRNVVRTQRNY